MWDYLSKSLTRRHHLNVRWFHLTCLLMYLKSRIYLEKKLPQKLISGPVKMLLIAFKCKKWMLSVSRWQNKWPLLTFHNLLYQILHSGLVSFTDYNDELFFINLSTCHVNVLLRNLHYIASVTDCREADCDAPLDLATNELVHINVWRVQRIANPVIETPRFIFTSENKKIIMWGKKTWKM